MIKIKYADCHAYQPNKNVLYDFAYIKQVAVIKKEHTMKKKFHIDIISDIKIIQSVNKQLDEEAIRVIKKNAKMESGNARW